MSATCSFEAPCCSGERALKSTILACVRRGEKTLAALAQPSIVDCKECGKTSETCVSRVSGVFRNTDLLAPAIRSLPSDRVDEELPFVLHRLASDGLWGPIATLSRKFPLTVAPLCAQLFDSESGGFWPFDDLCAEGEVNILFDFYKGGVLQAVDTAEIQKWCPSTLRCTFKHALLINYHKWLHLQPTRCELVRVCIIKTLRKRNLPEDIIVYILQKVGLQ